MPIWCALSSRPGVAPDSRRRARCSERNEHHPLLSVRVPITRALACLDLGQVCKSRGISYLYYSTSIAFSNIGSSEWRRVGNQEAMLPLNWDRTDSIWVEKRRQKLAAVIGFAR